MMRNLGVGHWRDVLRHAWLHRGVLAYLLWPLSWVYATLVRRRWRSFQKGLRPITRLSVPVVVVGNVVAGGAGKTPVVIALVRHCVQSGWKVGVVSRGFGRATDEVRPVRAQSMAQEVGDEPLLIARTTQVPVWVGRDRVAAAQALLAEHPELNLIISDDGLQHLSLARDLELCVFDERGLGNEWLLPAGPLREPWPRTHAFAPLCLDVEAIDAAATHASDTDQRILVQRALADYAYRADGSRRALWHWQGQSVRALAGIAKPEKFFQALQAQGLHLRQCIALPDHHDMQDVTLSLTYSEQGLAEDVLCTEKDAVKLWARYPHVWAVPLVANLPRSLTDHIDALVLASVRQPSTTRVQR